MVVTGVALTVLSQSRHGVDESNNPKVDMKFVDEAVAPADPDVTPTPLIDADATVNGTEDSGSIVTCLLYTSPSPRDQRGSRMPSSA